MTKPTILIFGASGQIGGALVQELAADDAAGRIRVVAAVRRQAAADAIQARGLQARVVDLDRPEIEGLASLTATLADVDRVFLLTGYDVRMLSQSKAVIDAASEVGVKHVVHLGAYAAGNTTIVHLGWHQIIEAYLAQSGLGHTNLRPNWFMQNLLAYGGRENARPGTIIGYIGDARPGWVDTNDIAAVAAAILRDPAAHDGQTYPLATQAASFGEIAQMLAAETGRPWRYEADEPEAFFKAVTASGADPVYMACVRNVFERTRNGSLAEASDVFDTIERLTGRAPTRLLDFVAKHRDAFTYPQAA
jgi:NAD(P)H dehydrogenase (quinone)